MAQALEWQPIKTAPQDGSRLLFWDAKRGVAISGCWHNDSGRDDPCGFEPPWAWWCADDDLVLWDGGPDDVPTHWMPLPPPPSEPMSGDATQETPDAR